MALARTAVLLLLAATPVPLLAQKDSATVTAEEFMARLHPRSGAVEVGGVATLQIPETFRYINAESARRLLTEAWGNPPDASEGVLGMIFPTDISPLDSASWAVVISFDEDGYVDDEGAEAINYDNLLNQMKEGATRENADRTRQGYATVQLVGWATPPRYNKDTHKLYWAKELAFSDAPIHTLNYNVRILGRRGVLVLNAIANIDQLPQIEEAMQQVIGFVDFKDGHRYADFVSGTDRKAAYGVAGLIAGAVAAKAGFFKLLWLGILAFKKLIVVAVAGVGITLKKWFGRDKAAPQAPAA